MAIHIQGQSTPFISSPPPWNIHNPGLSPKTQLTSDSAISPPASHVASPAHVLHVKAKGYEIDIPVGKNGEDAPLSDDELKQLYGISNRVDEKSMASLVRLLEPMDFASRFHFLDLASRRDTDVASLVRQVKGLGFQDASLFLASAVHLGEGADLKAFGKVMDGLSGKERSSFLETAASLAHGASGSIDLAHLIRAGAGDVSQAGRLLERVDSMEKMRGERSLFLAAASVTGRELGRFLDTVDGLSESDLTPFLEAIQGVEKGMGALLDLFQANGGEKNHGLIDFLTRLAPGERDDFLLSSRGETLLMDRLMALASPMEASVRASFFKVASREDLDPDRLLSILETMDASDQANFMASARTAGGQVPDFMDLVEGLDGTQKTQVLAFASKLAHHDLKNFMGGVDLENAATIAQAGEKLGEKALSYFLYALGLDGIDGEQLAGVVQGLDAGEQDDLLFMAANGKVDTGLLNRLEDWEGEGRESYLASQRELMEKTGREKMRQEFVFLNAILEDGLFEKMVGEDPHGLVQALDEMDDAQREGFLSLAKKASQDAMEALLFVSQRLEGETADTFFSISDSLAGDDLDHFIQASQDSLSESPGDFSRFEQLMGLAQSFTGGMQTSFLTAAGRAGDNLGRFMDMVENLGGTVRGDFVRAAAQVSDKTVAGRPLMDFLLDTSEHLYEGAEKGFFRVKEIYGRRPSQIHAMEFPTSTISSGSTVGYFRSAAWLTAQDITSGHMADWFNSFRGIPRTYMDFKE